MSTNLKKHEAAVDAYLTKLKTFLMTPDHGDGSWPDISHEALQEARELTDGMLGLKWGADSDDESPVKLRMWSKRGYRPVCDWAFISNGPGEGEAPDAVEARLLNNLSAVQGASSTCTDALRLIYLELSDLHHRKMRLKAAFEVVLVTYERTAGWEAAPHGNETPVSLHLSVADAMAFTSTCPVELGGGAQPPKVMRQAVRFAIPGHRDSPAEGYAEYRQKIAALCGKVLPHFTQIHPLGLRTSLD